MRFSDSEKKLEKIIREHPRAHLFFHDNGSWVIFKHKPDLEDWDDERVRSDTLAEGSFDQADGYLPEIVRVLAKIAGLTSDSI